MFIFILGREYKLSIAEILFVYKEARLVSYESSYLLLSDISREDILENAHKLGGTIKIIEIMEENILDIARKKGTKFIYGVNIYPKASKLKEKLNSIKSTFKKNDISSRYVNKDNNNLTSAQIIKEGLIKLGSDFNYINELFGITIWIQDIDSYSRRDYGKTRDMRTGMLPPKLAQMMINIGDSTSSIYDPFVGLGTILIEASLIGYDELYGSDLNEKMIDYAKNNIKNFAKKDTKIGLEKLNAKFINEFSYLGRSNIIVTEGYLGEIMTKNNISIERIEKQKKSLLEIYKGFFEGLKKAEYRGNIVISFPFWEINSKYIYFEEVYEVLDKYVIIDKLGVLALCGKKGSLLYKRDSQLVGREIFKLQMKG